MKRKKTAEVEVLEPVEYELYKNVRSIIVKARTKVYAAANTALVKAYWDVGREIVEKQGGEARSRYGDGLVARLSLKLTAEFGPGYNKVNLFYMRRFFLAFPKVHTLCKQLNWSHFRTLITIEDAKKRQFYLAMSICSDPFIHQATQNYSTRLHKWYQHPPVYLTSAKSCRSS